MSYTDYAVVFGDDPEAETYPEPVSGEDEATVRSALSTYGIQVPEGAVFQEQSDESSDLPGYECSVSQQEMETGSMTDRCTARFMTEESWEISAIIFSHVR